VPVLRSAPLRLLGLAVVVAGVVIVAARLAPSGAAPPPAHARRMRSAAGAPGALPAPHRGFAIPRPRELRGQRDVTRWAPVLRSTVARAAPRPDAPVVVPVALRTPEGTDNLVVAAGEVTRRGRTWVHVRLAVLPDGRTGWVPRTALGGWSFVDTRLVVDRARLSLTLYRAGRPVFRAPIGVGAVATPTPAGTFYVRDRLTAYASAEYGPLAFGTSARSEHETDWPAGGFIGIHGTDEPGRIPGRISHGCIRLRNPAILKLGRLLPVGTPVIIR
jgi:lipoprotein-anchoring transpeptidase ErfK/SrfK